MSTLKGRTQAIENLVGDLIFKLGKAHQRIHQLEHRVTQLESTMTYLHANQHPKPFLKSTTPSLSQKKKLVQ